MSNVYWFLIGTFVGGCSATILWGLLITMRLDDE